MSDARSDKSMSDEASIQDCLPDGARLGKYEIIGRLGKGGMSVIYCGRDTLLERKVAIKQIAPQMAEDSRWRERFKLEAQAIARSSARTKHTVEVYELLQHQQGLYIVMEFVEGHTLETMLNNGVIDLQVGLDVIAGICLGARAIHDAGFVHRDLKPSNIIVPPDRRAKITDFGLASHTGCEDSMTMGSTRYMAPELFNSGPVDQRCDIYSIGLIAFEMFAGREAFNRVFGAMLGEGRNDALRWMNWHLRKDLTLPRLDEINPATPPELAEIVAQMAAKPLTVRYESLTRVIEDLRRAFTPGGAARVDATHAAAARTAAGVAAAGAGTSQNAAAGAATARAAIATGGGFDDGPVGATPAIDDMSPTATLPPKPKPKRPSKWVVVAASIGFVGLCAGVYFGVFRQDNSAFKKVYADAVAAHRAERYADAAKLWRQAIETPTSGAEGEHGKQDAKRWLCMSEAEYELKSERFDAALGKVQEAEKLGVEASLVADLRERVVITQKAGEKRLVFQQHIAAEDLENAALVLRDMKEEHLIPDDEANRMQDLLDETRRNSGFMTLLRSARRSLERNDFAGALRSAEQAQQQQDNEQVRGLIETIKTTRVYAESLKAGDDALVVQDFASAARYFEDAQRASDTEEVRAKLNDARAREYLAAGRKFENAGRLTEAQQQYEQSLKFAKLPEASLALGQLQTLMRIQERIDAGQVAADLGNWDEALVQWQQALDGDTLNRGEEIRQRISMAQIQVALRRGDQFLAERKWAEAEAAYREAEQFGGQAEAIERMSRLSTERAIVDFTARGDTAREAGQFAQAIRHYREGLKLREPNPELETRIDDATYRMLKESGQRRLKEGEFRAAVADLKRAFRLRPDDDELPGLIAEAEKRASE